MAPNLLPPTVEKDPRRLGNEQGKVGHNELVSFVREPNNPYDSKAVRVENVHNVKASGGGGGCSCCSRSRSRSRACVRTARTRPVSLGPSTAALRPHPPHPPRWATCPACWCSTSPPSSTRATCSSKVGGKGFVSYYIVFWGLFWGAWGFIPCGVTCVHLEASPRLFSGPLPPWSTPQSPGRPSARGTGAAASPPTRTPTRPANPNRQA